MDNSLLASTRPFFVIYIVWHPDFKEGTGIAESIRAHFRRNLFENIAGGTGLSVIYRNTLEPGKKKPLAIDLNESETMAVVTLVDSAFINDHYWICLLYTSDAADE